MKMERDIGMIDYRIRRWDSDKLGFTRRIANDSNNS